MLANTEQPIASLIGPIVEVCFDQHQGVLKVFPVQPLSADSPTWLKDLYSLVGELSQGTPGKFPCPSGRVMPLNEMSQRDQLVVLDRLVKSCTGGRVRLQRKLPGGINLKGAERR